MRQSNVCAVSAMLVLTCLGLSACGGGGGGGGGGSGGGSGFPAISDVEPNDSRLNPQAIASLPVTILGTTGQSDASGDFFLITLTTTGNLTANLAGAASQDLDLFLYDTVSPGSGTGLIAVSAQVGSMERISVNGLPAGTYVVAMVPFFSNATTSYTLDISF